MNIPITEIKKYEDQYLNCGSSKVISYLLSQNILCEWIFFAALETTDTFFNHTMINKEPRWRYKSEVMKNYILNLLNIKEQKEVINSYEKFLEFWIKHKTTHKPLWVLTDVYWLKHRKEDYKCRHNYHWIMISSSDDNNNTFIILDDNSNGIGDFISIQYKNEELEQSFVINSNVKHYDIPKNKYFDKEIILKYFEEFILSFNDDFSSHERIAFEIEERAESIVNELIHYFSLLQGSRYLFSGFLKQISEFDNLSKKYLEISRECQIIKNLLIKYRLLKKTRDKSLISMRIIDLIEMEKITLNSLKIQTTKRRDKFGKTSSN